MGVIYGKNTPTPYKMVYNSVQMASTEWGQMCPDFKFYHKDKGCFIKIHFMDYTKEVLNPNLICRRKVINGQKSVIVLDGVITHCSHKLIIWCQLNNNVLVLRPPNTSSSSQPEDVILFKVLKKEWVDFQK